MDHIEQQDGATAVTANGNCLFAALLTAMGIPATPAAQAELRREITNELSRSRNRYTPRHLTLAEFAACLPAREALLLKRDYVPNHDDFIRHSHTNGMWAARCHYEAFCSIYKHRYQLYIWRPIDLPLSEDEYTHPHTFNLSLPNRSNTWQLDQGTGNAAWGPRGELLPALHLRLVNHGGPVCPSLHYLSQQGRGPLNHYEVITPPNMPSTTFLSSGDICAATQRHMPPVAAEPPPGTHYVEVGD
jgi:hypothetical protein